MLGRRWTDDWSTRQTRNNGRPRVAGVEKRNEVLEFGSDAERHEHGQEVQYVAKDTYTNIAKLRGGSVT